MSCFDHVAFAARTDVGKKRKNNEDAFGTFPEAGIFCVADGMGGGDDGEIASAAVIKGIEDAAKLCVPADGGGYAAADVAEVLETGLAKASEWMFNRAAEKRLSGCGSTFVGVVLDATRPDSALAVHAGDSRLYLLHGKSIRQITRDHSAAEMIGAKDENKINPMFRSMVMNAVGIKPKVDVETTPFKVAAGDRIVICSDGLSRMVPDKKIALISRSHEDVGEAADALIAAALEAGGVDNVTVVLVEVSALPEPVAVQQLPDPATGFVNDEKETSDPTGTTDPPTEIPGCETDAESQTMQTIQPVVERARIEVTRRMPIGQMQHVSSRFQTRHVVFASVVLCLVLLGAVVFFLCRPSNNSRPSHDDGKATVAAPASNDVETVENADTGASNLEVLLAGGTKDEGVAPAVVNSPDVPSTDMPQTDQVSTRSSDCENVSVSTNLAASAAVEQVPSARPTEAHESVVAEPPPNEPSAVAQFADACDAARVGKLLAVIRRAFPGRQLPPEYNEQVARFTENAKICARMRSEKDALNAVVDMRIMLVAAADARKAFDGRGLPEATRKWLGEWDKITKGDPKDEEVLRACERLISGAEEVRAP